MKRGGIYILLTALALMGIAFAGCGSPDQPDFESTLSITNASGVSKTTFYDDESVKLKLTVTSVTGEPITLDMTSFKNDFIILDETATTILWQASLHNGATIYNGTELTINPEASMTFYANWDLTSDAGVGVGVGNYLAQGYLGTVDEALNTTFSPTDTRSELLSFTIVNTP